MECHLRTSMQPSSLPLEIIPSFPDLQEDLESLEKFLLDNLCSQSKAQTTWKMASHIFSSGGKRIRPTLFFLLCRMLGYHGPHRIQIAAAGEYVHTASLLHDDVIDSSPTRRHLPTAHSLWGDVSAVLVGDLIYSSASRLMAQSGHIGIVDAFARAIMQMSEGEILQLEAKGDLNLTKSRYFEVLSGKTGSLLGAICFSCGVLSGCSEEENKSLHHFGHQIGVAFQLIDDALDYQQTDAKTGKKAFTDFFEKKVTLPLIYFLENANDQDQLRIKNLFYQENTQEEELLWIRQHEAFIHGMKRCLDLAASITEEALSCFKQTFSPSKERDAIEQLSLFLLSRNL